MNPHEEKLIKALGQYKDQMVRQGQAFLSAYPPDQIRPEIYSAITVPVPLQLALILYGLGSSLLNAPAPAYPDIEPQSGESP